VGRQRFVGALGPREPLEIHHSTLRILECRVTACDRPEHAIMRPVLKLLEISLVIDIDDEWLTYARNQ
jgi:hypothetical protein